jgi:hypothetical protein
MNLGFGLPSSLYSGSPCVEVEEKEKYSAKAK